jgi:SAM-dependent methyltransferase
MSYGNFALGIPTEYGFELPKLRHELSRPHLAGPDAVVLDFGCGNGANTVLFAPDVARIVGVDVAPEQVEIAIAYAKEHRLENVEYLVYDGHRLPFEDGSFDNVVTFEVLEHTTDHRAALAELIRVMKPGGRLLMSVPNKWYLMETHGFHLKPTWVKWNRMPLLSWLPSPLHERWANARIYTRRRILGLLDEAGFEVLQHRYLMPPFDRVNRPLPRRVLRRVFGLIQASPLRVVGVAHFIVARRL